MRLSKPSTCEIVSSDLHKYQSRKRENKMRKQTKRKSLKMSFYRALEHKYRLGRQF